LTPGARASTLAPILERLTYANVMATIAMFIALGASAYALSRNSVRSQHIAPGAVKASDTHDKLRLKCAGATRFVEGACLEREARGTANFATAEDACLAAGRRLPSVAEGVAMTYEPGLALAAPGEWTLDRSQYVLPTGSGVQIATVVDNDPPGRIAGQTVGSSMSYRCVAPARR
jgi:hypothetical protein